VNATDAHGIRQCNIFTECDYRVYTFDNNVLLSLLCSFSLSLSFPRSFFARFLYSLVNNIAISGWTATKLAKACGHDSLAQLLSLIEQRRTADRQLQLQCERVPLETQERVEGNVFKTNLGKSGEREIGNGDLKCKEFDIKVQVKSLTNINLLLRVHS